MFRIEKGYDAVSKTFRLPAEMVNTLQKLADENKISLNRLVIQCLQYSLENLENECNDSISNREERFGIKQT